MSRIFNRHDTWFANPAALDRATLSTCYYHFMFGLWLPLLNLGRRGLFTSDQRVLILPAGGFTPQIMEIHNAGILNIQIIPDVDCISAMEYNNSPIGYFVLDSLEAYFYLAGRYCVRPTAINDELLSKLSDFGAQNFFTPIDTPDVLIIDRDNGEEGHGASTRKIENVQELASDIRAHFGCTVDITTFEGKTMAQQLSLFRSAKLVISQHGSVLGHTIWMRPEASGVIELVPPKFAKEGWEYFALLCAERHIPRVEVLQSSPFAPAPIEQVISAIQKLKNLVE